MIKLRSRQAPAVSRSLKSPNRVDDSRAAIIEAAIAAFAAHGYEGAVTRTIASSAGVGHSLLLYHYRSKEALWYEAVNKLVEEYTELSAARLEGVPGSNPTRQLWELIKVSVEFSAMRPEFYRMLIIEENLASARFRWLVTTHLRKPHTKYLRLIEEAQRLGSVRSGDPTRLRFAVIALSTLPIAIPSSYKVLTGRTIGKPIEKRRTLDLIKSLLFLEDPEAAQAPPPAP